VVGSDLKTESNDSCLLAHEAKPYLKSEAAKLQVHPCRILLG
jgi:hypothetical protein